LIVITESFSLLGSSLFLPDFLKRVGVSRYFTLLVIHLARIPGGLLLSIIVEWPRVGRLNSLRFFTILAVIFFLLLSLIQTPLSVSLFLMVIYFSIAPIRGLVYTYISEVYPTSIRSVTVSYFYILETVTSMGGVFAGGKAANVEQHWIFPAVFAGVYTIQLCFSFALHYEPGGKGLKDNLNDVQMELS
jgi:MFS family permease